MYRNRKHIAPSTVKCCLLPSPKGCVFFFFPLLRYFTYLFGICCSFVLIMLLSFRYASNFFFMLCFFSTFPSCPLCLFCMKESTFWYFVLWYVLYCLWISLWVIPFFFNVSVSLVVSLASSWFSVSRSDLCMRVNTLN